MFELKRINHQILNVSLVRVKPTDQIELIISSHLLLAGSSYSVNITFHHEKKGMRYAPCRIVS